MVKTTDIYPTSSGSILRADDIVDDIEVVITGYQIREFKYADREETRPVLSFAGLEKGLKLNVSNKKKVEIAYGIEMDDWIGKKMILYPEMVRNPKGPGLIPSIVVRVPQAWHVKSQAPLESRPKPVKSKTETEYDEMNPPPSDDDGGY